jgi:hypothetical protein
MNRKKLLLFILLISFALAATWGFLSRPQLKTVENLKFAPGKTIVAEKRREAAIAPPASASRNLRLDLLDRQQPSFSGYHRNIFKPIFVDEVREIMKKSAVVKPVLPPPPIPKPTPPPPPPPVAMPETPAQALARFTFLGFMSRDAVKTIFLAKETKEKDKERDIILVKKGDTFGGRYEAAALTDQALTILVTDTGDEIVVPLIENQALKSKIIR